MPIANKKLKKSSFAGIRSILMASFFDRAAVFGLRSIIVASLINVFNAQPQKAANYINLGMFFAGIATFLINISFSRAENKKVILFATAAMPICLGLSSIGVHSQSIIIFMMGFCGTLTFGGAFQAGATSIIQARTKEIKKYNPKLAHKIIVYLQWAGNAGIAMTMAISPIIKVKYAVAMLAVFAATEMAISYAKRAEIGGAKKEGNLAKRLAKKLSASQQMLHKESRKTIKKIIILTLLLSTQMAIVGKMWTSWNLQGSMMNQNVFGIKLLPSQIAATSPFMYAAAIYIANAFAKKRSLTTPSKFIVAGALAGMSALYSFGLQVAIEKGVQLSILWQLFSYIFVILSDCIYLVLILHITHHNLSGHMQMVGFSIANLRFVIGFAVNYISWSASNGSLKYSSLISALAASATIIPAAIVAASIEMKRKGFGRKTRLVKKLAKLGRIAKIAKRRDQAAAPAMNEVGILMCLTPEYTVGQGAKKTTNRKL